MPRFSFERSFQLVCDSFNLSHNHTCSDSGPLLPGVSTKIIYQTYQVATLVPLSILLVQHRAWPKEP